MVLIFFTADQITGIYLNHQNSLHNNGNWISSKTLLEKGVQGAMGYIYFNQALAGNRLNLGAWRGFNEVLSNNKFEFSRIEFNFFLTEGSYLNFIIGKNENDFGIRLSSDKRFPDKKFILSPQGEFIDSTRLTQIDCAAEEWHTARAKKSGDKKIAFYIDGEKAASAVSSYWQEKQPFGFRGGFQPVYIDNITVWNDSGEILFQEDFTNRENRIRYLLPVVLTLLLMNSALASYQFFLKKDKFSLIVYRSFFLNFSLFAGSVLLSYYFEWRAERYPAVCEFNLTYSQQESYENFIATYYPGYWDGVCGFDKLSKHHISGKREEDYQIVVLGGSQTWGEGACSGEYSIIQTAESLINIKTNKEFNLINLAKRGARVKELFRLYRESLNILEPDAVLLNISNNDLCSDAFKNNLLRFILKNKRINVKTILSLEANPVEVRQEHLFSNHRIMEKYAEKYGLPVIDLHTHLAEQYDSGFLWWDKVHMTSSAQQLAGEYLAKNILEIFKYDQVMQ